MRSKSDSPTASRVRRIERVLKLEPECKGFLEPRTASIGSYKISPSLMIVAWACQRRGFDSLVAQESDIIQEARAVLLPSKCEKVQPSSLDGHSDGVKAAAFSDFNRCIVTLLLGAQEFSKHDTKPGFRDRKASLESLVNQYCDATEA